VIAEWNSINEQTNLRFLCFIRQVSELSETNALLRDEIRMKEDHFVEEKREYQAKIDALEREKSSMNTTLASLESQLSAAPNQSLVDNMKRELRILKRLEYNADDVDTDRDPEIVGGGTEDEKDLEAVLVAKLRRSEKELISERNGKTELMKTTESLRQALAESEKAKQESDKLVASLEQDLERAIATPAATELIRRESKGQMLAQESSESLQHILDPNAPPPPKGTPSKSSTATEKAEDDHSVATIVMAQRDRLRARCEALEAERDSFKRELQGQVQASESLKADNTKLYEKVRYLQNYNTNNKGTTNMAYRRSASTGDRDLDLEALEQRYEASVDPFKQFSKSERQRKLGEMSPMERTVFMVAKAVLCK
jgi:homeobox protein cut-like